MATLRKRHALMFAANDGDGGGGGPGGDEAIRLRDRAAKMARILAWHAEHSPLTAWQDALSKNELPQWPGNLFHALCNFRPKRPATPKEVSELVRLYGVLTRDTVPDELLRTLASDPDWHLFALSQAIEPHATGNADDAI